MPAKKKAQHTKKAKSKSKKSTVKKAVKKTAKKTTKKTVKKTTKKVVKKAAKKAVKKTVKKATKKTTKKAGKPVKKKVVKKVAKPKAKPKSQAKRKATPKQQQPTQAFRSVGPVDFTPYHTVPNEHYMSGEQLAHFRDILERWRTQLMQEVDSTVDHMKSEAIAYPDPLDRAAQEEGFSLELRTRDRERKLIRKIEQSLDNIDSGDYGFCESCGANIGIRRLEARPTADKCIDCKTYEEIREKQSGH